MTDHFKPLWARNVPKFGVAHAMALGVREGVSGGGGVASRCCILSLSLLRAAGSVAGSGGS